MPKELTRTDVELWWQTMATGEVHYTKILDGQVPPSLHPKLRRIIHDIVHAPDPIVEPCGRRDGYYRLIQPMPIAVNFGGLPTKLDSNILLPFGLRDYCFIYNKTVIVVAGSKSSGKTGFLYRTAQMNMEHLKVVIFSTMEGGAEQMKDRFMAMGVDLTTAPIQVFPLTTENPHHLMKLPDTLYIIDYIDCPEGGEFYLIAGKIAHIAKKLMTLGNSLAVVGLQKPPGRDLAFGGANTLKDATLYISLDKKRLKIVDAKVPANPTLIPNNMIWKFRYEEAGTKFEEITRDYGKDSNEE